MPLPFHRLHIFTKNYVWLPRKEKQMGVNKHSNLKDISRINVSAKVLKKHGNSLKKNEKKSYRGRPRGIFRAQEGETLRVLKAL